MAIGRGGLGVQAEASVTAPADPDHPPSSRGEQSTGSRAGALATSQVYFPGGTAHRPAGRVPGLAGTGRESQGTPLLLSAVLRASSALDLHGPPAWLERTRALSGLIFVSM